MKVIKYTVNPDGTITLDFNGFQGKICIDEFQKIIEALREQGIEINVDKQELKQEYYVEQREVVEQ